MDFRKAYSYTAIFKTDDKAILAKNRSRTATITITGRILKHIVSKNK